MSKVDPKNIDELIVYIGGRENIVTVTHCITRLRFVLNDESKVNAKAIEELPMVKANFSTGGQYQVVIGQEVGDYYKILLEKTGLASVDKEQVKAAARQNQKWYENLISHMADIFIPLLPALISGGLILGFRNVIGDIKMFDDGTKTLVDISTFWASMHSFLWLIGEAIFFFLPVGICWSIARKMGTSPILGITLGITLVSSQLMNSYALGSQIPEVWDFGLFSIEKVGYQAQVIPAIMAGLTLSYIERFLNKIVPDFLNLIIVPVTSLILAVFLAHSIIGPIGREIGNGVAFVVKAAMTGEFAPIGAALFGFLYAPLVVTGVHQTSLAIDMQMIQSIGGTPVWPLIALSNIAQASAVVAVLIMAKKASVREIAVPAALSAYLGVTEPAMYGINLKYRFPMLCAMTGSACAALICGFAGVLAGSIGVGGLPGILSIQHQYWGFYALAMLVAIVVPIVLTMAVYKRKTLKGEIE
ncbi:PTS trehalose transporter subunit IIBC [Bisgaard Taxon 10/6]|uniref:PTS trehalose transporter subunit IIBC n=1 Tax=Exercitatus varius TaxID=67857 RepID=A0ABT6EPL5_9PAST|nr:PTS trehalose transporter subunit IIBC [Exercitatus varius]MDG2915187.1 PTS trehalose transporter subunit IIBC [Exercitatus varius]MDG2917356.1 PTS trehalose transporter subunit IIBC [Exercitatus varius]MDG2940127.1 PTS trehalose transporter subunit IIBC [Exercitatus varius]MDG2945494.1 PTS trehalose transporter subunit IIBC [Exercitatus varius]MDG2948888.1 PTS trehalose transporter subunit IIBC [Exercitatus varius]